MLIPVSLLVDYLGEKPVMALRNRRALKSEPQFSMHMFSLANRAISSNRGLKGIQVAHFLTRSLKAELLHSIARLIEGNSGDRSRTIREAQFRICQDSIGLCNKTRRPISIPGLVSELNVNRRTLERAFRATLDSSPYRFMRMHRLNGLHKELRKARARNSTVTPLLLDWGFNEPGRTAVEYRQMFGKSPSETLNDNPDHPDLTLSDAIVDHPT